MALARWQATITDEAGNIVPSAQVTVRAEIAGAPLARLYTDRQGTVAAANPITADADGYVYFHVTGGAYRITATKGAFSREWRYVGIGRNAESDLAGLRPQGAWDAEISYSSSDYIRHNERTFVSLVDENLGNEPPDAPEDSDVWMWVPLGENAELAIEARDLAQQWAAAPEDQTVEDPVNGDGFSSFHWSKKSEAQADRAEEEADRSEAAAVVSSGAMTTLLDPQFATKATAEAFSPVAAPDYIRTSGYTTAGDGGGALYAKVVSEPSHEGKISITLNDGETATWYEIAETELRLEHFGAVGDNSTDNTSAVQDAIDAAAALKRPIRMGKGVFVCASSIALPGGNNVVEIISDNVYDTAGGSTNIISRFRYTGSGALFVGATLGTASAPFAVRLRWYRVAADCSNSSAVLFDFLNLQWSRLEQCWFRNWNYALKGKISLATRIVDNTFLNIHTSAISNRLVTGGAQSMDDSWIRGNYISGAPESNNTVLIDIFYPNLLSIEGNFIDFGVICARLESGFSYSFSRNQVDYCVTGLQLKAANGWVVEGNRFTHINKANSTFWTAPTTAMQNNNWKCIEMLLGTKSGVINGNLASGPDRYITMAESTYSQIKERGSIVTGYTGPLIDMTSRTVGSSPDGEGLSFESMDLEVVTTLPKGPTQTFEGHRIMFYDVMLRNKGGRWIDPLGGVSLGRSNIVTGGDFSTSTGWTLTSSESITGGELVITANSASRFVKAISTQSAGDYVVFFDITERTVGSLRVEPRLSTTSVADSGYTLNTVGPNYFQFTSAGDFDNLSFLGASFTGKVDNLYLVKLS